MEKGVGTAKVGMFAVAGLWMVLSGLAYARPSNEAFGQCVEWPGPQTILVNGGHVHAVLIGNRENAPGCVI
jgi:hypothetical protein